MSKQKPPSSLIEAFRSLEAAEQIGVLVAEDGFDPETVRVIAAFLNIDHTWRMPSRRCPDRGRPTAAAYSWLMSGYVIDHIAIADAAGVSRQSVVERMAMLIGNRLIYPDGTINIWARKALQTEVAKRGRTQSKGKSKGKDDDKAAIN